MDHQDLTGSRENAEGLDIKIIQIGCGGDKNLPGFRDDPAELSKMPDDLFLGLGSPRKFTVQTGN